MVTSIENPSLDLSEETGVDMTPTKGDQAINNHETTSRLIGLIDQTDYEEATKELVRGAIEKRNIAFMTGMLDDLEALQKRSGELKVEVDLDGRIDAVTKIRDAMLF